MNREDTINELSVPIMGQEEEVTDIEPTDAEIEEIEAEGESDLPPEDNDWDELAAPAKDGLVAAFRADMEKFKVLPHEEQIRLAKILRGHKEGDAKKAHHDLTNTNLRLVVSIAKKYIGRGLDFSDLISEGILGLMKALEKFEYERGYRLSTYASWWIRQRIDRAIKDSSRTIRIPVYMQEALRTINRAYKDLFLEGEIDPDIANIAKKTGITTERIRKIISLAKSEILSLQFPIGDDGSELGDFLCDDKIPLPEEAVALANLSQVTDKKLSTLTPREEKVVRLRFGKGVKHHYGLQDREYTLEEIGAIFDVTRERIRQIEAKALQKLRHPSRGMQYLAGNQAAIDKMIRARQKKPRTVSAPAPSPIVSPPSKRLLPCFPIYKPSQLEKSILDTEPKKGELPMSARRYKDRGGLTSLVSQKTAKKLRGMGIKNIHELVLLTSHQLVSLFSEISLRKRIIRAMAKNMLEKKEKKYYFADGEEATRALMSYDPKTYGATAETPASAPLPEAPAAAPAVVQALSAESPPGSPPPENSLRATLQRFSAAFDFLTVNGGNPEKIEGYEENFKAENGQEYTLSISIIRKKPPA